MTAKIRTTVPTASQPAPDDRPPITAETAGLTEADAARRLQQYGENALAEHHVSVLERLVHFFWGPIPWMIEAAAVLSGVLRHWDDLAIILVMLFIDAGVGFWQEFKDKDHESIAALVDEGAEKGYRTLGALGAWRFLGLLPLFDPPRDDCAETIKTTRAMGVDIKMVTGDQEATAAQIAGQLGLGRNIVVAEKGLWA